MKTPGHADTQSVPMAPPSAITYVFKSSAGGYRVRPAHVIVKQEGTVYIRNLSGSRVTVFFDDDSLFDQASVAIPQGELGKVGIRRGEGFQQRPFAVYVHDAKAFAQGNSHPEVIAEP